MKLNRIAGVLLTAITCMSTSLTAADVTSTKYNGCKGPSLCSSFPLLDNGQNCCYTWHLDVGLLYQQPIFNGNSAGSAFVPVYQQTGTAATSAISQTETTLNVAMDYVLGVTASVGYLMHHDNWFFGAKFDWLSATSNTNFDETNTFYLANRMFADGNTLGLEADFGIFAGSGFDPRSDYFDNINYNANIDIYALDVLLSRGSYISNCFSYEPWMGVEALWFSTATLSKYYTTSSGGLGTTSYAQLAANYDVWGAGPTFGFNGEYYITEGLSFFSDSNVALLIGEVTGKYTTSLITSSTTTDPLESVLNANNSSAYMLPIRSIIGVKLSSFCLEDKHFVALKLGYDVRVVGVAPNQYLGTGFSTNGLYADLVWNF
jgi:hypothetical protein